MKTKVLFRRDAHGSVAVFPDETQPFTLDPNVGHSGCSRSWYVTTQPATPAECRQLRAALKARGYGALQVLKRWPRTAKGGAA